MIDHTGVGVSDFAKSKAFYEKALAPLGYVVVKERGARAGFGAEGTPEFWIAQGAVHAPRIHVAFRAKDRATVRAFYEAAIKAGGRDNGPPGIRAHYHPDYYGAFVLDPDGHNVEAVCRTPEG